MVKLFACIISQNISGDKAILTAVAQEFSYLIETLEDGVVFDVSGLDRLVGTAETIAKKIRASLHLHKISGSIAVAATIDSACLIARQNEGIDQKIHSTETFAELPLSDLPVESDTLNALTDLGIHTVEKLLTIPRKELIARYGTAFQTIIDVAEQKRIKLIKPNVKETSVDWSYELDQPVQDFEQLIFVLNHGFEKLFSQISMRGLSTEHLDIKLGLKNKSDKNYEIKTAFPTLDRAFWLKIVNLRASLDPPQEHIIATAVTAHFTKPRPAQPGLYAISHPEPESLLLTANKLKKLVGERNVGLPVILDQRVAEPFALDADALPKNIERLAPPSVAPKLAFVYYRPPLNAEVTYGNNTLTYIRTRFFEGRIKECSGVWKKSSTWWDKSWELWEWDVEVENRGIYRLCRSGERWLLLGEYD